MKVTLIVVAVLITLSYGCSSNTDKVATEKDSLSTATKPNSMMGSMDAMNTKMMGMQMTDNPEKDFAAMMKVHHLGAIAMANLEINEGKNSELLKLAAQIKKDQENEIMIFDKFITDTKDTSKTKGVGMELMASMKGMADEPHDMSANIDAQFLSMMIPHHQGAIDMAKVYLKYAKDATLMQIATQIVSLQQKEIDEMKAIKP